MYYIGVSLSKQLHDNIRMSHEAVRTYYRGLKTAIQPPQKKRRRLIAIDETKLKTGRLLVPAYSSAVMVNLSSWLIRVLGMGFSAVGIV